MASPKTLKRRLADLELGARVNGDNQAKRRLAVEKKRFLQELVTAANNGDEGAATLVAELRRDLIQQHVRNM
jgi:hypothetical protein